VVGLVVNSLVCLVIAGSPAEAAPQRDGPASGQVANLDGSPTQLDAAGCEVFNLVEPSKDALVVELGRSRLVRFPEGIRRTALSNADVSDVVQVGPQDVLVLGRKQGVANLTVWPANPQAAPAVIVVRVEQKLRRDQ
jgi:Flp pilus assembly secretin CpaC